MRLSVKQICKGYLVSLLVSHMHLNGRWKILAFLTILFSYFCSIPNFLCNMNCLMRLLLWQLLQELPLHSLIAWLCSYLYFIHEIYIELSFINYSLCLRLFFSYISVWWKISPVLLDLLILEHLLLLKLYFPLNHVEPLLRYASSRWDSYTPCAKTIGWGYHTLFNGIFFCKIGKYASNFVIVSQSMSWL